MPLSSSTYFVFLVAVFFLYWPLSRSRAASLAVILFANYFFVTKWGLFYLFCLPALSAADFCIALALADAKRWRKLLVTTSIVLNVGAIVACKYVPFALESYTGITGLAPIEWHWSLPLGLSFYAFQAISYVVDVYRGDAKPSRSPLAYFASVSFFPTILAGPITRPAELVTQWEKRSLLPATLGGRGLFFIGIGLVKKLLIADYLSENLVNRVFDFPTLYSGFEVLIGVYAYALQLYYDFSGYSDIAIGSALLLGLKLPANFNRPYMAGNIAEFWRRWHITLSNWLRDYVYFSLPGLRSPHKIYTYAALVVTMIIGGLWHGPSWNFVIWGLLHGIALAVVRAWQGSRFYRKPSAARWRQVGRIFATVQFVCFAWIFFRAATFSTALAVIKQIGSFTFSADNITLPFAIVMLIAAAAHYFPLEWRRRVEEAYCGSPFYVQSAAMVLLVMAVQYVAQTGSAPFIYSRF